MYRGGKFGTWYSKIFLTEMIMYLSLLRWREYNFKTVSLSGYDRPCIPEIYLVNVFGQVGGPELGTVET